MNSAKKDYLQILIFQVFTFVAVAAFFAFIQPPKVAALFAGTLFLAFGIFALVKVQRRPSSLFNPLLYLLYIHLFAISIPLMCVRLLNWDVAFGNLLIFGYPAPLFHTWSGYVYTAILVLVVVNLLRAWISGRVK